MGLGPPACRPLSKPTFGSFWGVEKFHKLVCTGGIIIEYYSALEADLKPEEISFDFFSTVGENG